MINRAKPITAISFDGDMTLWDFRKAMRHALSLTLDRLHHLLPGEPSSDLTVDRMIEIRNTIAAELKGKIVNLEEIRFHAFRRTLEIIGCPDNDLAANLNDYYLKHRFDNSKLYPDVIPALDSLRSDHTVGLLSNGNGYPERCGLGQRFDFVVFSQDVGIEKPDPMIFRHACSQAGCDPGELVHVGDSLESDVAGANSVGAVSVWLNRDDVPNDSGIAPDHTIRTMAELSDIVDAPRNTPD